MSDVLIVGGGVMGTAIAAHLAEAGVGQVTLLEKRFLGAGSSGKSGAILRQHYSHPATIRMAQQSLADYAGYAARTGRDIGFRRTGVLLLAAADEREALERNVRLMQSLDVDTQLLETDELRRLAPHLAILDGTVAAWEPGAGYVDPVLTVEAFGRHAREHGADLREGVAVTQLLVEAGRVRGVRLGDGAELEADHVVHCAGPWASQLLEPLGVHLPLTAVRPEQAFFGRPPGADADAPIVCDLETGLYWKPEQQSWTRAGNMAYDEDARVDPDDYDEGVGDAFLRSAGERLARRVPAYEQSTTWGGCGALYTLTPDAYPVIGPVADLDDLLIVGGWSGHGFKMAPAVGRGIAGLLTTGDPGTLDLDLFAPDRFARGEQVTCSHRFSILG